MRIERSIFRYVEHELYCYDTTKKLLKEIEEDIIYSQPVRETIGNVGFVSDPTARKAMKLISSPYLAHMTRVVNAIDNTLARLTDDHRKLFEYKYRQCLPWQRICSLLAVSESTYFKLRHEIVAGVALQLGLINWDGTRADSGENS